MGTISVGCAGPCYVLTLSGRGTIREGRTISECIIRAELDGMRTFVLDLVEVDYLDSTCLGTLVALHQRCNRSPPPRFSVAAPAAHLKRLFGATRLDTLLPRITAAPPVHERHEIPTEVMDGPTLASFVIDCHRKLAETGGSESASFLLVAEMLARQQTPPAGPPSASK
jgi:anti-anti-sigma factor